MASPAAVVREAVLRPRWLYHRWRDVREHVHRDPSHQGRMAEYERHVRPMEDAIQAVTGASAPAVREALAAAPRTDAGPRRAISHWYDGTHELAAVLYAVVRLRRARSVVETGVARGVSSTAILQAMQDNDAGHLRSLDLPGVERAQRAEVGVAVPASLHPRWTLRFGPSRMRLPGLLREAAPVDVFVHDSAHTYRNMRFEFAQAARHLAPGGLIVSDDVCNDALLEFVEETGWNLATVRQSKPAPWTYVGFAWA